MQQVGETTLDSASWSSTPPPMTSLPGVHHQHAIPQGRAKGWALSQWPRRPSCLTSHGCLDGHGDPFAWEPDQAVMGYTLRVDGYRCVVSNPFGFSHKCQSGASSLQSAGRQTVLLKVRQAVCMIQA
jgi:hypothetical protein